MGQRRFDTRASMYAPVNISITLSEWDEFLRIAPMLGHADIFWHNRKIQGVDDIVSVLDELGMENVFKGDPRLHGATHRMYIVRNDYAHGRGTLRYDPDEIVWTVRRHIEKALAQMPPLLAVFLLHGAKRAQMRGDAMAADALYRRAAEAADAADADPSARHVIAGKAAEGRGMRGEAIARYEKAVEAGPANAGAHAALGCILAQAGRYGEALAEYDRAVEIEPSYANAHGQGARARAPWPPGRCP